MILWRSKNLALKTEPVSIMVPAGQLVAVGRRMNRFRSDNLTHLLENGWISLRTRRREWLRVRLSRLPEARVQGWLSENRMGFSGTMDEEADARLWMEVEDRDSAGLSLTLWLAYASVVQEQAGTEGNFTQ
jgi:hypothetical protein